MIASSETCLLRHLLPFTLFDNEVVAVPTTVYVCTCRDSDSIVVRLGLLTASGRQLLRQFV